ncbi:hypothetical protein KY366_07980 [Candidatus Woesearchaeota archaeon]|nr:hypothetical protein [Candidatus Woesearchaeota archaeon]
MASKTVVALSPNDMVVQELIKERFIFDNGAFDGARGKGYQWDRSPAAILAQFSLEDKEGIKRKIELAHNGLDLGMFSFVSDDSGRIKRVRQDWTDEQFRNLIDSKIHLIGYDELGRIKEIESRQINRMMEEGTSIEESLAKGGGYLNYIPHLSTTRFDYNPGEIKMNQKIIEPNTDFRLSRFDFEIKENSVILYVRDGKYVIDTDEKGNIIHTTIYTKDEKEKGYNIHGEYDYLYTEEGVRKRLDVYNGKKEKRKTPIQSIVWGPKGLKLEERFPNLKDGGGENRKVWKRDDDGNVTAYIAPEGYCPRSIGITYDYASGIAIPQNITLQRVVTSEILKITYEHNRLNLEKVSGG